MLTYTSFNVLSTVFAAWKLFLNGPNETIKKVEIVKQLPSYIIHVISRPISTVVSSNNANYSLSLICLNFSQNNLFTVLLCLTFSCKVIFSVWAL